jgi:hypothetical protein
MTWDLVSPLGLLKNPMILIAGFSMLIVFGMPYIMDNSSSLSSQTRLYELTGLEWTRN